MRYVFPTKDATRDNAGVVEAEQWRISVGGGLELHVEQLASDGRTIGGPVVSAGFPTGGDVSAGGRGDGLGVSAVAAESGSAGGARSGDGGLLVLVHGIAGSAEDWAAVAVDLAASRPVVAYDHRGHGASGWAPGGRQQYTFDLLFADLVRVLDALGPAPVHLLGHSMGGVIALRYALEHPRRLRSLILVDTAAEPANAPGPIARRIFGSVLDKVATTFAGQQRRNPDGRPAIADRADHTGRDAGNADSDGAIRPIISVGHPDAAMSGDKADSVRTGDSEDRVVATDEMEVVNSGPTPQQRAVDGLGKVDPDALAAFGRELGTYPSLVPRLGEITVATTVIVGERDSSLRASARTMADAIPGARLAVIAGADHSPHASRPLAWLTAVDDHFARLTGTDPARG
ncbi:AB hydrolase-1 domain-containing protein [Frankia sp. AiPs1]|uniref:alpha/beta fold hydrolase n=1 Tax=Frankia sp. AiPa1 TaxID=573492 RepID=UPI00202ACEAE|nr:alpha/beta hydrolase [Frankia sp. AiPa1]MCL9759343.1 alpha/beta fold hydrolase [Frankia sp. AiPa1]